MRKVLTLVGHCPGKKNLWRRGNGRTYIDSAASAEIDALIFQAKAQWRGGPVEHPTITATFHVRDERGDLDNKFTTLQDCLVKAGVLVNDNMRHLHGPITFCGEVGEREDVVVVITEGT